MVGTKASTTARRTRKRALRKCQTGISGFDGITNGGLPRHSITLVSGGPGAGKTVFSLEFLYHGARDFDEPGVCVSFEESPEKLIANAASSGMDLKSLVDDDKLAFFDARISPDTITTGDFDIMGLLAMVEAQAARIDAKRIVFDGLDILISFLSEPTQRLEIWRLNRWLEESDFAAIVSIKSDDDRDDPIPRQYSWMEYIPDVVVSLRQSSRGIMTERKLRILKYRGSGHVHNDCAVVISDDGLHVAEEENAQPHSKPSLRRVSTGVAKLDDMMEGGYLEGAGILVTGSPGTAKTTLASTFANSACARGEKVIYFAFDESGPEIVRNMASVGIDLAKHVKSGQLIFYNLHSHTLSPEESYIYFFNAIDKHAVDCVVIDPLSSIDNEMSTVPLVVKRLLAVTKERGITSMWTSLLDKVGGNEEMSKIGASTCADVWVHLSNNVRVGERNRALTIIKSRGTAHSNKVSELVLSRDGVTLEDVYSTEGEMYMGAAKAERMMMDELEEEVRRAQYNRELRSLSSHTESLKEEIRLNIEDQAILEANEATRALKKREYGVSRNSRSGNKEGSKSKGAKTSGKGRTGQKH